MWRSLVSRLVRVQEASGSNPDTPTKNLESASAGSRFFIGVVGFERPLRKHAGGMFLGRGRIPRFPGAVLWTLNGNRMLLQKCQIVQLLPKHKPRRFLIRIESCILQKM